MYQSIKCGKLDAMNPFATGMQLVCILMCFGQKFKISSDYSMIGQHMGAGGGHFGGQIKIF